MSRSPAPRVRLPRELIMLAAGMFASVETTLAQRTERNDRGDRSERSDSAQGQSVEDMQKAIMALRQPIFYPPNPPPLGRPVSRIPQSPDGRILAPVDLAPFISDIFYPVLGSRYHAKQLKEAQRRQLEAYDLARTQLLRELRDEIARVNDLDPAARLEALMKFSATQTPRLKSLEGDAEKLRRELLLRDTSWTTYRDWRLGDKDTRGYSPREIATAMRGYAFYHDTLSLEQRHLLREIAIELDVASDDQVRATAAQPFTFFPPEPARVLFPAEMPEDAARKLAEFQTRKSALKKELYEAVHRHDGGGFFILRGDVLGSVANKQITRLAELEKLAEEIRRAMPPTSGTPTAIRSTLPSSLTARVDRMMEAHARAQREAAAQIDAIMERERRGGILINYRFDQDGLKFVVVPDQSSRRSKSAGTKIESVRNEITPIVEAYGRSLADLINERAAISAEIGERLGSAEAAKIESALVTAMRAVYQRDAAPAFEEYRFAIFEPGLSPAQRRLLLHGVIQRLDLPLPRGEFQPFLRGDSW